MLMIIMMTKMMKRCKLLMVTMTMINRKLMIDDNGVLS